MKHRNLALALTLSCMTLLGLSGQLMAQESLQPNARGVKNALVRTPPIKRKKRAAKGIQLIQVRLNVTPKLRYDVGVEAPKLKAHLMSGVYKDPTTLDEAKIDALAKHLSTLKVYPIQGKKSAKVRKVVRRRKAVPLAKVHEQAPKLMAQKLIWAAQKDRRATSQFDQNYYKLIPQSDFKVIPPK